MSDKITLQSVSSVDNSLINAINNNNATLVAAIDNTLSRDGTSPNQMNSTLDMNSHQIINIPFATSPTQPVPLGQLGSPVSIVPALTGDVTGISNGATIPTTLQPLSGDVTSVGRVITLDTVNSNIGSFGNSTSIPIVTVNGKGLTTSVSTAVVNPTQINSVTYPASPSTNTVPVITGVNTVTYEQVPGAAIASNTVANSNLVTVPAHTYKGNNTGSTATPIDVTNTQLTADLNQFTSSLQGVVPGSGGGTTNFLRADSTWVIPTGVLISSVVYSGSQTITIPAGASQGFVRMWGGTGGSGGVTAVTTSATGGTGAGAYLEKILTGLTAGNTLTYTQGGAGAGGTTSGTTGGNGGASTLASGTQTISTLTANGSNGSTGVTAANTSTPGTAGGTSSGGDVNISGEHGMSGTMGNIGIANTTDFIFPGSTFYSRGAFGVSTANAIPTATAGNAGQSGGLNIKWYA